MNGKGQATKIEYFDNENIGNIADEVNKYTDHGSYNHEQTAVVHITN
jgi:hypothetical protein